MKAINRLFYHLNDRGIVKIDANLVFQTDFFLKKTKRYSRTDRHIENRLLYAF